MSIAGQTNKRCDYVITTNGGPKIDWSKYHDSRRTSTERLYHARFVFLITLFRAAENARLVSGQNVGRISGLDELFDILTFHQTNRK